MLKVINLKHFKHFSHKKNSIPFHASHPYPSPFASYLARGRASATI